MNAQQFSEVRASIPSLSSMTYLDSAGAGLPPLSVTNAMTRFVDDWSKHGEHWEEWLTHVVELRRLYGQLVGGRTEEVGVVPSVSVGLAAVASCLDPKRKKVVTSELNFPTNVVLWQRMREKGLIKNVELLRQRDGRVPLEAWEKAIDGDTAAVAVDYVSWFSGYREHVREISELARKRGALLIVDGFHATGVFPIDVKKDGIDVFVGGFYKWLCGPHGAACVYVDREALRNLEPGYTGWHGINDNVIERLQQGRDVFDLPFPLTTAPPAKTAARFEWGTWAVVVVDGAVEAVKFALQTDPAARWDAILKVKGGLIEGLENLGFKVLAASSKATEGSGIVTFGTENHTRMVKELAEKRIIVSGRFNHVRVSPHFYNTREDVGCLLDALKGRS